MSDFSIARGAPFANAQEKLGLLTPSTLAAPKRAAVFALFCWLPLLALAIAGGTLVSPEGGRSFMRDLTVHARFLVAVPIFILLEQLAEPRLAALSHQFLAGGLLVSESATRFEEAIRRSHRRRDSWVAELVLFVLAYVLAGPTLMDNITRQGGTWAGTVADGAVHFTPAGWWMLLVAGPLFAFLLFRWLWRYLLWANFLRNVAGLDLRLVATHPDRAGGLAFVSQYPATFAAFAFACSVVGASMLARALLWGGASIDQFQVVLGVWVAFFIALFTVPLFFFAGPIKKAKRAALLAYSTLSSRHNVAFEKRWLFEEAGGEEKLLGAPDPSSLADLATGYEAVKNMLPVPLSKEAVLPVVIATVLPLIVAAATQVPLREMLGVLKLLML
jgi:hypothetical protein